MDENIVIDPCKTPFAEAELLARMCVYDDVAWSEFIAQTDPLLRGYAQHFVRDLQLAEDAA